MTGIAGQRCRAVRLPLGPGPDAAVLAARAAGWEGLVCLHGAWAGGTPLLTSHPLRVDESDPGDLSVLGVQPEVELADGAPADVIGGGWFGWLAYEGASRLAFHDHLVRLVDGQWYFEALWSDERDAALRERMAAWRGILSSPPPDAPRWQVGALAAPPFEAHLAAVERAVELIRAGEIYQVNVCTRLDGSFTGSPAAMFADVAAALRPARGAFVQGDGRTLVSLSPELFLELDGRAVRTAPIKGTLPREPEGNERRLRESAKDVAENVMIVDLMRNDLGRVCEYGSVRVPALVGVEPHPGVWHLVSSVTGRLRPDVDVPALLRATFPPGSVTGAPKVRAVEAITALERAGRGAYTGAIGFVSPSGRAEFSVAIRTFEITGDRIALGVGGGITADSVPMLEWRECRHKAAPLLAAARSVTTPTPDCAASADQLAGGLLETVLVIDGAPVRLADHLARLDRSCRELYDHGIPPDLDARARAVAGSGPPGRAVLRIVLRPGVEPLVTVDAASPPLAFSTAVLRARPPGLWRHKWADRVAFAAAETAGAPDVPLYLAADGTVLETSRGNVFLVRPDGGLITAPLRDDLLPGVTRRALLDLARDIGRPTDLRPFTRDDLLGAPAFWTSSLSGAVPIHSVDGLLLPRADGLVAEFRAHLRIGESRDR